MWSGVQRARTLAYAHPGVKRAQQKVLKPLPKLQKDSSMRMWMIDPKLMCRTHLLGEHYEIHMLVGALIRGKSLHGYISKGLVEVHSIQVRHAELVREMVWRGYHHHSPLQKLDPCFAGSIDPEKSKYELARRCSKCRERIEQDRSRFRAPEPLDFTPQM